MTEWIDRLDYILIGAMLALTLLGFIVAAVMPGIEKWNKRFFAVLFSVLFLLVCLIIADMILFEAQVNLTLEKLIWFIESALLSLPMFMFTIYLLHFCGENRKKSLLFWTALICLCIYLIRCLSGRFLCAARFRRSRLRFLFGRLPVGDILPQGEIRIESLFHACTSMAVQPILISASPRIRPSAALIFTVPLSPARTTARARP